nr:hypothetical protein [Bacteroidota bacterium]
MDGFDKTDGDKDFGWNTANVDVDVWLTISSDGNKVLGSFKAHATEVNGDTKGDASRTNVTLYTNSNPAFKINRIVTSTSYSHDNFADNSDDEVTQNVSGGLISKSDTMLGIMVLMI